MKKIVFVTGTRADYGKLKSVILKLQSSKMFEVKIYVTGMHLLKKYGLTYKEIEKDNINNIYLAKPINVKKSMDEILAINILQFTKFIKKEKVDMIFVHGDRVEALAATIVGSLNNIYVSHIEGGEVSGTIDESIRHAISKFAHFHFVTNENAKKNLIQMGENQKDIFVVGSPDIDIMLRNKYDISEVKKIYDIPFNSYGILIYHPVTTEIDSLKNNIKKVVDAVVQSNKNYIVIFPNNDMGSQIILKEYSRIKNNKKFLLFPSLRFEYFLTLLKNAEFVIGNSSLGIRESGFYGIPTINIGSRQDGRFDKKKQKNIICVKEDISLILTAIKKIKKLRVKSLYGLSLGKSDILIYNTLKRKRIWKKKIQKKFITIS